MKINKREGKIYIELSKKEAISIVQLVGTRDYSTIHKSRIEVIKVLLNSLRSALDSKD